MTIAPRDPLTIIAGIRQFGLAPDGADLRDLEAAICSIPAPQPRVGREEILRALCCPEGCQYLGDSEDGNKCFCDTTDLHGSKIERQADAILALPASAGEGWKPIETAPRNATEIELRFPKKGHPGHFDAIGHWADGGGDDQPRFRGWFRDTGYGFAEFGPEPTHWRPRPAPPSEGKP